MKDLRLDFGAVGNGTADDTAAIQAGLDWAAGAHDELFVPVGQYKVTSQLTLVQKVNFSVRGAVRQNGTYNTTWKWAGSPGGTMLLLDGCRDTEWCGFALDGSTSLIEPAVILDLDKITVGSQVPRKNAFRGMLLRGGSLATVRISHTAIANNEGNIFEDCEVAGIPGSQWVYGVPGGPVGYLIQNINAKNQQIIRGVIAAKECAVQIDQGSAQLHGVEIGACNVWVRKGGGGEPLVIESCDGDSSVTFLEILFQQSGPVVATGNRFVQRYDGPLFIFGDTLGPVTFVGNEFASGGYRPNATTVFTGGGPRMTAIGNTFPNGGLLPIPGVFPPRFRGLYSFNNMFYGPGNSRNFLEDVMVPYRETGQPTYSLKISGPTGFAGVVQAIASPTAQIVPNQGTVPFTTPNNLTLVNVNVLLGMFEGQEIKLVNIGAFSLTLQDRLTLSISKVALTSASVTLSPRQSMTLTWSAALGLWLQTGPVVTPL